MPQLFDSALSVRQCSNYQAMPRLSVNAPTGWAGPGPGQGPLCCPGLGTFFLALALVLALALFSLLSPGGGVKFFLAGVVAPLYFGVFSGTGKPGMLGKMLGERVIEFIFQHW